MFGTIFSSTYRTLETQGVDHDEDNDDDGDADDDAYDADEYDDDDYDDEYDDDGDDDETCQGEPQFQFDPNQQQHLPD